MKKETLFICLFGGPSSGKSTTAFYLAYHFRKLGYETEYVGEVARDLIFDGRPEKLDGRFVNEMEIIFEKNHRLERLDGKVDIVIVDAPILQSYIYYLEKQEGERTDDNLEWNFIRNTTLGLTNQYNTVNIYIERGGDYLQKDRVHTFEEALKVDAITKDFFEEEGIAIEYFNRDDTARITSYLEEIANKKERN